MSAPRTRGFHHVTMVARDAQRTVDFYAHLLGLGLVKRTVNFDDPTAYHLYFGDDVGRPGTILTFFEWKNAARGRWGAGGVHHVALGVATPEAQLKWKRRLTDHGVSVTGPLDRGYFTSLYFEDPDGQFLEIATAGPGYTFDEPAERLGQEVVMPSNDRLPSGRDADAISATTWPKPVPRITSEMRLDGIHHVSAITDDLERNGAFYEEALGLRLVKQTVNQDDGKTRHFFWAAYQDGLVLPRSSMTLFDWSKTTVRARPGAGQTHHVAFRARDAAEQEMWRDHLLGIGIKVSPVMNRSYFQSIYFRAPDGLLVEIATDSPGFTVDEPADSLGQSLKLPDWLEARRPEIEDGLVPIE